MYLDVKFVTRSRKICAPPPVDQYSLGKSYSLEVLGKILAVTTAKTRAAIPTAARVNRFTYAIRNIVAEAHKVEAAGVRVQYLNIGDPVAFGFQTPPHLISAVERAMRDGHNGYGPS